MIQAPEVAAKNIILIMQSYFQAKPGGSVTISNILNVWTLQMCWRIDDYHSGKVYGEVHGWFEEVGESIKLTV